jgi:hypothetical protein
MTEAPRTEIELEEGAFLPGPDRGMTPFAELSRLMVVAADMSSDKLVWKAQSEPNGPWGDDWTPVSDTDYGVFAAGSTTDGRVAIAAQTRTAPKAVHYIDEQADNVGAIQNWNPPVDLGLPPQVEELTQLCMTRDADGRIAIFGVDGQSGTVWWIFQNPDKIVDKTEHVVPPGQKEPIIVHVQIAEPPDEAWSSWSPLSGAHIARITVANNADGRILVAGTGQDPSSTAVYVNQETDPLTLTPAQWSGWTRIDTPASGTSLGATPPSAVLDPEGAVNIFMIGDFSEVVQLRQDPPGSSTWAEWVRPGMTGQVLVNVASAFDGHGHIVLAAIDENRGLHANYQIDALHQTWTGWQKIGVVPDFGRIVMDYNSDGRLTCFQGLSKTDGLAIISQVTPDSTSWSAGWTSLASSNIASFQVVRDLTPPASTD